MARGENKLAAISSKIIRVQFQMIRSRTAENNNKSGI